MAEIQRSSRRRVFMVSVLKTELNSSHFTHIQGQISPSRSLFPANPRAAKHHPFLFNEWRETWWMTMKEAAFWAGRSKVFQAYQGTCYVMSHISLLEKWRQMNTCGWICTAHPTVEGAKKKRGLKLAEEIIVRAKTDAREERRSNEGLSKKCGQACCWQLFLFFFHPLSFLHFSPGYIFSTLLLSLICRLEPK